MNNNIVNKPMDSSFIIERAILPYTRIGKFTLRSGRISDLYIDVKGALLGPNNPYIIQGMKDLIQGTYSPRVLVGHGYGGALLVAALKQTTLGAGLPAMITRSEKKDHGLKNEIISGESNNFVSYEVIIVEDVITSGGSVIECYNILKEAGHKPEAVFTVVSRLEYTFYEIPIPVIALIDEQSIREQITS